MIHYYFIAAATFPILLLGSAKAEPIDGALNLNSRVPFATLAIVPKAVHSSQISKYNRYSVINEGQTINLSGQHGYCFIATHFDRDNQKKNAKYRFQSFYIMDDTEAAINPAINGRIPITGNNASRKFPSYCISSRSSGDILRVRYSIDFGEGEIERTFFARFT